jgi:hypothetical protein
LGKRHSLDSDIGASACVGLAGILLSAGVRGPQSRLCASAADRNLGSAAKLRLPLGRSHVEVGIADADGLPVNLLPRSGRGAGGGCEEGDAEKDLFHAAGVVRAPAPVLTVLAKFAGAAPLG